MYWRAQGSPAQQPMPAALIAPARAKPRHDKIPAAGFHAECYGVAVWASVAFRQDEEENDRSRDQAQDEEADENNGKDDCVGHPAFPRSLQALLDLYPRLHVSQVAFDSFDYDFRANPYRRVIETSSPQGSPFGTNLEADLAFPSGPNR